MELNSNYAVVDNSSHNTPSHYAFRKFWTVENIALIIIIINYYTLQQEDRDEGILESRCPSNQSPELLDMHLHPETREWRNQCVLMTSNYSLHGD